MTNPLLSILIPTVVGREEQFIALAKKVSGFTFSAEDWFTGGFGVRCGNIEVCVLRDNKEMTIGQKREELYKRAKGLYSWQLDDDDDISDSAIDLIIYSIKQEPDCITFRENCMINGQYFSSNHSLKYDDWGEKQDGFDYVRTPFYKDVIKTEIAKSVPFEYIRYGEDHAWSRAIKPHLKSEVHINEELYFYIHNSKPEDHAERYGIK